MYSMKLFFPLVLLVFVSCKQNFERKEIENYRISGSDTGGPMVSHLLMSFEASFDPTEKFSLTSTGTSAGIKSLIEGKIEIANASRPITDAEKEQAKLRGIEPIEVIIAHDALAIITNINLGIDSISIQQLRKIYIGEISNWKEIGGPDLKIIALSRPKGSGTRQFFQSRVVGQSFCKEVQYFEKNADLVDQVKANKGAIAFVGVGAVMNHHGEPSGDVWGMYLYSGETEAVSPYERTKVRYGKYPLCRPLFQYFAELPQGDLLEFLRYELSDKGQTQIESYGYFAINDEHRRRNKRVEAIL